MVHQVLANGVVPPGEEGYFQLGTDPIGAGDQYGVAIIAAGKLIEPAKAAQVGQHLRAVGAAGMLFDALDRFFAGADIHTSSLIAQAGTGCHPHSGSVRLCHCSGIHGLNLCGKMLEHHVPLHL